MTIREFKIQYALGVIGNPEKYELVWANNTAQKILEILAKDTNNNDYIRTSAISKKRLPEKVLQDLKTDKAATIRVAVIRATNDPSLLEELSRDKCAWSRYHVIRNNKTPITVLKRLSKDPSMHVRQAIAQNKRTPKEILIVLAQDEKTFVRTAAKKRLENLRKNDDRRI